jgi:peptide/nickel transport system ATP-binding protein
LDKENGGKDVLLSIRDLKVQYLSDGEIVHAVNGVSFDVSRGQTFGLVGETGAGKTTIAKSILRVLPDPPAKVTDGTVTLDGQELFGLSEKQMRKIRGKKISMVFQDPMTALNPVIIIGEQIREVIKLHERVDMQGSFKKAVDILEMVGIPAERYSEYPHQFSGGMKQRVVIAMALACNPELLIADEPTTALDVTIQAQVLDMINKLKAEQNTSMILITHDLGIVAEVCDMVGVVYAGQIIEVGTKVEIFDYPSHPYTRGLFGSIPKLHGNEKRLHPVPGMPPNPTDLPKGCHFNPRCPYATEECRAGEIQLTEIRKDHLCRCCNAAKLEVRHAADC